MHAIHDTTIIDWTQGRIKGAMWLSPPPIETFDIKGLGDKKIKPTPL